MFSRALMGLQQGCGRLRFPELTLRVVPRLPHLAAVHKQGEKKKGMANDAHCEGTGKQCIVRERYTVCHKSTRHMVHGKTYLHMYGQHMHRKTAMIRMLWVMMGMCVRFVAPGWLFGSLN